MRKCCLSKQVKKPMSSVCRSPVSVCGVPESKQLSDSSRLWAVSLLHVLFLLQRELRGVCRDKLIMFPVGTCSLFDQKSRKILKS